MMGVNRDSCRKRRRELTRLWPVLEDKQHMQALKIQNFIDGRWQAPLTGAYLANANPATSQVFSEIPRSGSEDVDLAARAAQQAFPAWSRLALNERATYLHKIADRIETRIDEFAEMESRDQGKPVHLARAMDMNRVIQNFRFFADEILRTEKESFREEKFQSQVLRKPVGVAGLISPWNLPLYLLSWKIAPALACGNTVVCKPSELTSMTAALLAEVSLEVGLPAGVLNIVFGLGTPVGEAIVRHPKIPLISFTGGTETGKKIYRDSAENFKKISLELGGKNPNIIFADCNLEKAIAVSLRSSFLNQGEICLCGSRIYVEDGLYPRFLEAFVSKTSALKVGDPRDSASFMGALVSKDHFEKVKSYLEIARQEGGKILCGGEVPKDLPPECKNGYFLQPTVIVDLPENSRCVQEEIFGPVVTVSRFRSEEDVIHKANGIRYGLSATVWSEDLVKANRIAAALDVGTVWINDWLLRDLRVPFGGMKHSGIGREGGQHSIDFFTEATTIVTPLTSAVGVR
jgi:aminomuconate-semialdehyde/2-hydroxymuconate-6-semialdehyde dehydrogenase